MINFKHYISEDKAGTSFADKSKKSGISVATLRKVYNRGVAACKSQCLYCKKEKRWSQPR